MSVLPCFAENPAAVEAENYLPARGGDAKGNEQPKDKLSRAAERQIWEQAHTSGL